jgi:hypothetical protein
MRGELECDALGSTALSVVYLGSASFARRDVRAARAIRHPVREFDINIPIGLDVIARRRELIAAAARERGSRFLRNRARDTVSTERASATSG